MKQALKTILSQGQEGICSVCSAHPWVIETALRFDLPSERIVLIEATSNQVNQFGGYTGMTPVQFREFVYDLARKVKFPTERIFLGGDHLGPNPWREEPAENAMKKAEAMIRAYVESGFKKIHLDASMPLGNEAVPLPASLVAERTARLCQVAEEASTPRNRPFYVIGTEVPIPGGETEGLDGIEVTRPERLHETVQTHETAFRKLGLEEALERVIAVVVQPGVDFSDQEVMAFEPAKAQTLVAALNEYPRLVFEAHSTDYQTSEALRALVSDQFAILKVGPALTFAMREGIFALAAIENELIAPHERSHLRDVIETVMKENPKYWQPYYKGDETRLAWLRGYSLSDRIRYYWGEPKIDKAVGHMLSNLEKTGIPLPLLSQYFSTEIKRVGASASPLELVRDKIQQILEDYRYGCQSC